MPSNIIAPDDLRPFLARSRTFRRQCYKIGLAHQIQIRIAYAAPLQSAGFRALSTVEKYADGFISMTVHLYPPHVQDPELIAHEFEHALEQAEGPDLRVLAGVRGSGVHRLDSGAFETRRAVLAGETAAGEFISYHDPK